MLRKRSRANSKQVLMADYGSFQSPTAKFKRPSSSFFSSPWLFTTFATKGFTDTEYMISPTSILDSKPCSAFRNPFWSDTLRTPKTTTKPETKTHWDAVGGVGLGIVDALGDELSDNKLSKAESRMVVFGSQLRIQIPPLPPSVLSPSGSPKSPADFGIKTRNSQLGSFSAALFPPEEKKSPFGSANSGLENPNTPTVFTGSLSASEMELSEEYTCVISHGPNPRTTRIFDDCIIESIHGVIGSSASRKENGFLANPPRGYPSESFLSFCYTCKKNLGQGKDIYMYRGDKAFCSRECRHKEMILEEEFEKLESNDVCGNYS